MLRHRRQAAEYWSGPRRPCCRHDAHAKRFDRFILVALEMLASSETNPISRVVDQSAVNQQGLGRRRNLADNPLKGVYAGT
jgi:hypothetical protein